jgi:hypothetical protein
VPRSRPHTGRLKDPASGQGRNWSRSPAGRRAMASRHSIIVLLSVLSSPRRAAATHNWGAGAGRICTVEGEAGGRRCQLCSRRASLPPHPPLPLLQYGHSLLLELCALYACAAQTPHKKGLEREERGGGAGSVGI